MSSNTEERLLKMREERAAREKARIDKLRELNLKKYNKNEPSSSKNENSTQKLVKSNSVCQMKSSIPPLKNNFHQKRPITAPAKNQNIKTDVKLNETKDKQQKTSEIKEKTNYLQKNIAALADKKTDRYNKNKEQNKIDAKTDKKAVDKPVIERNKPTITNKINNDKLFDRKGSVKSDKVLAEIKPFKPIDPKLSRKSMVFTKTSIPGPSRKSMIPKIDTAKESVFDRLYKSKTVTKNTIDEVEKLKTDPNYLKKVIRNSDLILKRHSCFDVKQIKPVRRSISAVHFKRINKNEASNCIHKWSSIGDKLNKQHLTIDEGGSCHDEVTSAVKSERKKVTFLTPKLNTPRPDELQARLKSWLQKRGKSLNSYHHLQCFGIDHLQRNAIPKIDSYDEENKENIAVESCSDDGSFTDNMVEKEAVSDCNKIDIDKWRNNDSFQTEFNETGEFNESTVTSADTYVAIDELLVGALNDLTELLKEGFDPEQAVRYLRAIRARFPLAPRTAAYWECRAALEERRGDLHASVQCWEEAIAKGTEHNVVEANLDTLLNKFMQLKISPRASKPSDSKMVDVKNVFKSTIIRFAVQQAKLRQSEAPLFTVTPVRRSGRLSIYSTPSTLPGAGPTAGLTPKVGQTTPGATPRRALHLCDSVKQAQIIAPAHVFTINENLVHTP